MSAPADIPFNRASLDGAELDNFRAAIDGGHISGVGRFTRQAEERLSELHGGAAVLLTTSCTHALELSSLLLDLEAGDEVVVPSFTFVSTAAAFLLHGARPVFVDVDPNTLNADPSSVAAAITPRTRAICAVNYAGFGSDLRTLAEIADHHDLMLIEDNAHGLGGRHHGQVLGTFGALSTLSFHETKNVTCGEGGALVINDPALLQRAEILREKGTDRARFFRGQVDKYTWVDIGSSWVLSDLLAAVLVAQLDRLELIQARRHTLWARYHTTLSDWAAKNGVRLPIIPAGTEHTAHLFHLRLADLATRTRFIQHLAAAGVQAVFHYQPLHLSDVGLRLGGRPGQHPVTEEAADTLVRLPLFVGLDDADQERVMSAVLAFDA